VTQKRKNLWAGLPNAPRSLQEAARKAFSDFRRLFGFAWNSEKETGFLEKSPLASNGLWRTVPRAEF
jgi:hypothetical protein